MKNTTAFIFARSGSKGLKDKNIKDFAGKPLIAHTITAALESKIFDDVVVSTNSKVIAAISECFGASVPFLRPEKFATDHSDEILSWKHTLENYKKDIDCFVSLPCTCPLRDYKIIKKMINFYDKSTFDIVVGITSSNHSPYFNMVSKSNDDSIKILMSDEKLITRRQDSKKCYSITTFGYITNPSYILKSDNLFAGQVGGYLVQRNQSIDIDDIDDFEYAEYLFNK